MIRNREMRFPSLLVIPTLLIALAGLSTAAAAAPGRSLTEVQAAGRSGGAPISAEATTHCALPDDLRPELGDRRCEKWSAVYDDAELHYLGPMGSLGAEAYDLLQGMVVSPAGDRVFTFGRSGGSDPQDTQRWAVVAHDGATGDLRWVRQYEPPWEFWELTDIAVSPDGAHVYLTGFYRLKERDGDGVVLHNWNALTVALSAATGQTLWWDSYGHAPVGHIEGDPYDLHSRDGGTGLAVGQSRVYVTGYSDRTSGLLDLIVIAYDAITGDREWVTRYDSSTPDAPHVSDEAALSLAELSGDGRTLYVVGESECDADASPTPCGELLLAYGAEHPEDPLQEGQLLWAQALPGMPRSFELGADGSHLYLQQGPSLVARHAGTGELAWTARPEGQSIRAVVASPRGDTLFVTGSIVGQGSLPGTLEEDFLVAAHDAATGDQLWSVRDNWAIPADVGRSMDAGYAIAVSPDGDTVYATGRASAFRYTAAEERGNIVDPSQATGGYDAATGEKLWGALYGRAFFEEAGHFIEVGPDGTVFTAGNQFAYTEDVLPPEIRTWVLVGNRSDWGVQAYEP